MRFDEIKFRLSVSKKATMTLWNVPVDLLPVKVKLHEPWNFSWKHSYWCTEVRMIIQKCFHCNVYCCLVTLVFCWIFLEGLYTSLNVKAAKGQLYSEWIYDVIVSPKMPTKNFKDFFPGSLLKGRAEILKIFGWYCGRNDDLINSFWI